MSRTIPTTKQANREHLHYYRGGLQPPPRGYAPEKSAFAEEGRPVITDSSRLSLEQQEVLDEWMQAKRARDFSRSDQLRSWLEARGIRPEMMKSDASGSSLPGKGGGRLPPPTGSSSAPIGGNLPPGIDAAVGDWQCVSCANWNWARRKSCNMCNAGKEGMMHVKGSEIGNTSRSGAGGGFREMDDEEEARRKRRAVEERSEKEFRKAQKVKCEYCKRFSCIC